MKNIIAIIGGLISAGTCLIPLLHKEGDYTDTQNIINAIGLTLGSGLMALSYSLNRMKYWYITMPISALLLFYSFCYLYDRYLDVSENFKTKHFTLILLIATSITLIVCVYYKYQQRQK